MVLECNDNIKPASHQSLSWSCAIWVKSPIFSVGGERCTKLWYVRRKFSCFARVRARRSVTCYILSRTELPSQCSQCSSHLQSANPQTSHKHWTINSDLKTIQLRPLVIQKTYPAASVSTQTTPLQLVLAVLEACVDQCNSLQKIRTLAPGSLTSKAQLLTLFGFDWGCVQSSPPGTETCSLLSEGEWVRWLCCYE